MTMMCAAMEHSESRLTSPYQRRITRARSLAIARERRHPCCIFDCNRRPCRRHTTAPRGLREGHAYTVSAAAIQLPAIKPAQNPVRICHLLPVLLRRGFGQTNQTAIVIELKYLGLPVDPRKLDATIPAVVLLGPDTTDPPAIAARASHLVSPSFFPPSALLLMPG